MPTPHSQMVPYTSLKAGYSHLGADYTHRIWETTDEDVFSVSVDTHRQPALHAARASTRTASGRRRLRSRSARRSRRAAGMRHFDIADRDRQRFTLHRHRAPAACSSSTPRPASAATSTPTASTACSRSTRISTRSASRRARRSLQPVGQLRLGGLFDRCSARATPTTRPSRPTRYATGPPTTPARSTSSRPASTSTPSSGR